MKRQLSLVMISLSWVAWLVAVFALPTSEESSSRDYAVPTYSNNVGLAQIHFNVGPDVLEIPEFKVDWNLNSKLNPDWYFDLLNPSKAYLSSSFFNKSIPLFDVKDTFRHFFHTW